VTIDVHDKAKQRLRMKKLRNSASCHSAADFIQKLVSKNKTVGYSDNGYFDHSVDESIATGYYKQGSVTVPVLDAEVIHFGS